MLSSTAALQTSFFKFSLTPYYSSSRNVTILLYESLEMITTIRKTLKMKSERRKTEKLYFSLFSKILTFCHFFGSVMQPSFGVSTSKKAIDVKILPASIYSRLISTRKWTQIEIWMYETSFNFDFKCLAVSLRRRLHFSNFPWHRITLRVGMCPSCSTSH